MQAPNPPGVVDTRRPLSLARSYAENCAAHPARPDEMAALDGSLRPHWRQFVSMLDDLGSDELRRRWDHARRLIHDNGVTHNVYGDPEGLDRPWSLDLIPLLIPSIEWNQVAAGLTQRALLLDRLMADLYGPAETIFRGLLPPELVWANPGFLRACHGINLPRGRWLHVYAADLVRTTGGQYQVLADRTQAPSGAGYTLENRIVLSQTLPGIFRHCNVERLAPYFASLRESLAALAPASHDSPRVVLLTPGPYNETYFEHSYLARYLGYFLVQGNDLTVRDAKVYLKTLGGLKPVDVILRRVDDNYCDPLELFADSYLGVPGLLQAVRDGNVAVANALGSGVLQTPGFLPFLPSLCRHLLGEDLKLHSVPTWWCGQQAELSYVLANLPRLVVKSAYPTPGEDPIFGHSLTREQLAELSARIQASPSKYVAQEQVMAGTTPALVDGQPHPRRFVVRAFLAAQQDSYTVMSGALTRITHAEDSLLVSLQRGGGSKDTWVLSDAPVAPVTLLPEAGKPAALSRGGGDLPSRIADDLFWLGRFVERAEAQVRLARGILNQATDQSGTDNRHAIAVLTAAWPQGPLPWDGTSLGLEFAQGVLGDFQGNGLRGTVACVHGLARILRSRTSSDAWRILREIHMRVTNFHINPNEPTAELADLLDTLVASFAGFVGLASDSMVRGQAWKFLDIGRRIERVAFVTQLLRDTLVEPVGDPMLLEAVLEIADSQLTYRRRYFTRLETHAVVDLLLADETNPRAAAFQLVAVEQHLATLPRDTTDPSRNVDQRRVLKLRTSIQLCDLLELCATPEGQRRTGLENLLREVLEQISLLSDAIANLYFSHTDVSTRLGESTQETM
ncbi:MAG: circularly permuted type 2 ATP-grasp protein [Candidatus Korobacteraceae bacterium]